MDVTFNHHLLTMMSNGVRLRMSKTIRQPENGNGELQWNNIS